MVAASLLIAAPSSAQQNPNPSPVLVVDPTATATFTGSGWGHGVGMSQWGGLARAQAGHSAQQILGFYYENTVLAENYGRPANGAEPPSSLGPSSTATPAAGESATPVVLATTGSTTLTPEGLNRITVDNQNIAVGGQNAARAPAGTPIDFARVGGLWQITFGATNVCGNGCSGQTVQLHFATDTAVAVSTTGRSYSHGRINLIAVAGDPNRFHITVDSLTIEKFFRDPHSGLPTTSAGPLPTTPEPVIEPAPEPAYPEEAIRVHLTTTTGTTLTPQGANRITIDGQGEIRVPAGYPVAITRHAGHWHIVHSGTDVCGNGCSGNSVQLHFATNTSVAVSNTGRSYSHGRINLVPSGGDPSEFYVIVDSLSMEDYLRGIAESPMNWGLSVHKAQAIAARSYASASLRERRASASWTRPFDLYSTVWDQAYVGDLREKHADAATWLRAVEETAGQVLYHGGAPIRAFYHASNGGHTERSGYVFSADLPYLPAKADPFDSQSGNPYASWSRSYTVADLNRWLNDHSDTAVGKLISMEALDNIGNSGRLDKARITITGTSRSVTVTGSRLQSRINTAARESGKNQLLSTLFTFSVPPATIDAERLEPIDPGETPPIEQIPADEMFYSGVINGPDFCVNRSLGGPITYAFDSDADGIADVCSLPRTRREAVAHQRTLEGLASTEGRDIFTARFAEECRSVAETFGEPDKEASDECQRYREFGGNAPGELTPANGGNGAQAQPTGQDADDDVDDNRMFYSGIIDGPDFCLNFSLGGPTTYAFDSDGDGVADVCALPRTRREAVARQKALEHLAHASRELEIIYAAFFSWNCLQGPRTLGEPDNEANDACQPHIQRGAA
ncbi:MAG: SpoIID/LytB domain-containing protein [bacterium]|nr:SpoIID/LytB domain-containing protein [bacterium]